MRLSQICVIWMDANINSLQHTALSIRLALSLPRAVVVAVAALLAALEPQPLLAAMAMSRLRLP